MANEEIEQKQKHAGGRPRILQSVEAAESLIDLYFKSKPEKPTISGLALYLGFTGRNGLMSYVDRDMVDDKEREFAPLIEKAVSKIENEHESRLYGQTCTGSIFWLKNRGWTDSHDITSGGEKIKHQVVDFSSLVCQKQEPKQEAGQPIDEHSS